MFRSVRYDTNESSTIIKSNNKYDHSKRETYQENQQISQQDNRKYNLICTCKENLQGKYQENCVNIQNHNQKVNEDHNNTIENTTHMGKKTKQKKTCKVKRINMQKVM